MAEYCMYIVHVIDSLQIISMVLLPVHILQLGLECLCVCLLQELFLNNVTSKTLKLQQAIIVDRNY